MSARPCKGCPEEAGIPPKPWRLRRVLLDETMLLRLVTGETLIVEHKPLPADSKVVFKRQNGTDVELYVQSAEFSEATCCFFSLPAMRVNYSTGE